MARAGGSSKFVPVNLNKSYGQQSPNTNTNNAAGSASLSRSRSYGGSSHGGMVYLTRSSRVSSSSVTVSAASPRVSKLSVPRPVNLPSLRREHAGNDPNVALVGGSGSSGWSKQVGEEASDSVAVRSDGLTGESTWGNSQGKPPTPSESVTQVSGRPSAYTPPGSRNSSSGVPPSPSVAHPVEKAVVFRGEDFPTLQAAAVPGAVVSSNQQRQKDPSQKQRFEVNEFPKKQQPSSLIDPVHRLDSRVHSSQVRTKGASADDSNENSRGEGWNSRGPSPLIHLNHTSNWADDERETLSTLQPQDRNQSEWSEQGNGDNWGGDYNVDAGYRRPTSRGGYSSRNDMDSKPSYGNAARFDMDYRGDADRFGGAGRSDLLKRGWSFSAVESNSSRDGRFWTPENSNVWERDSATRGQVRGGNMPRPDSPGWDASSRDVGQAHDYRALKGSFSVKQGFNNRAPQGDKSLRGNGFLQESSSLRRSTPGTLGRQEQIGMDYMREKRTNTFPTQLHTDDPFLGDIISTRSGSFLGHLGPDAKVSKMKKETAKGDDIRDPAREHFEAELERVQKMLELERHKAIEEQERALELARKEQEEQERIAREEEELRLKLEEEAREAAARAQREAEETARKAEELRKAREEQKRIMALEEERRKEAARRKLLELEERIAKRANEKKQDEAPQVEGVPTVQSTQESYMQPGENGRRGYETNDGDHQAQFMSSFKTVEKDEDLYSSSRLGSIDPASLARESRHGTTDPASLPRDSRLGSTDPASLPSLLESPSASSHAKLDQGFSMRRHRQPHTWKREPSDNGQNLRVSQKGPPLRNSYSQGDAQNSVATEDRVSTNNTNDRGSSNWWNRAEPPISNYLHQTDSSEYSSYGRLRQSLPKQPRVLPPPPRQTVIQTDGSRSVPPTSSESPKPREEFCHRKEIEAEDSIPAVKQFEPTPSEEVVLSDAVSQFSDDSIDDVPTPVEDSYQEQDLHSDVVSEPYSEEADEISDLTDAQESSEEAEAHVAVSDLKASTEDVAVESGSDENMIIRKDDQAINKEKVAISKPICDNDHVKTEFPVTEDVVVSEKDSRVEGKMDEQLSGESQESHTVQTTNLSGKDTASDRAVQDTIVQATGQQLHFLSANALDVAQMGHSEGMASRQNLVQQFQQPFSFMAVPLPQPNTMNNVAGNPSMLSSLHGLQNQQELPFHLQLGLLPGMPLLPNAIQIGSIQMPLHIHPQIPQFAHMHGQQTPVFQFGQIGHSVSITQPSSVVQPGLQVHHTLGQTVLSHQHQQPGEPANRMDNASGPSNVEKVETGTGLQNSTGQKTDMVPKSVKNSQSLGKLNENAPKLTENVHTVSIIPRQESEPPKADVSLNQQNQQVSDDKSLSHNQSGATSSLTGHDQNVESSVRSNRGRRRSNGPRYRGILGNGNRGRFQQNYSYQISQSSAENWNEGETKRMARGKPYKRNPRRTEYKVRRHVIPMEEESTMQDVQPSTGAHPNTAESREKREFKTVKDTPNSYNDSSTVSSSSTSRTRQTLSKGDRLVKPNGSAAPASAKGIPKKYEADTAGDAPLRTGVVCVFEQPGIETQNDKDDFIKVRSKRQLLREQREQREKESKAKSMDSVHSKRSLKNGLDILSNGNTSKNSVKRKIARDNDNSSSGNKLDRLSRTSASVSGTVHQTVASTSASTTTTTANEAIPKKSSTSQKPGQSGSLLAESGTLCHNSNDNHSSEQPTTIAWGGQRSNQEVVSFTQIQLEEAMKPFRAEGSFTQPLHAPERSILTLEPKVSPVLGSEKLAASVKAPGPISSLLAGEKIQFGAVTSPPLAPAGSSPQSPRAVIQIGSPLGLRSEASHVSSNPIRSVANYLESDRDATFTSKDKCNNENDNFQGKVADLEAEAEAAASAVAVAAISNEDPIENHRNTRVSVLDGNDTSTMGGNNPHSVVNSGLSISRPGLTQPTGNNGLTDNSTSVSLPADLSVDMPPTLFQSNLPASSGVMLQSLQGAAAPFPCLEMGPMLGGPIFTFGPREDASYSSLEPGLAGWQQRHLGAPESFYGTAPPFMSPAGLPGIQGHPHMLVYANPFTPVGQFGQLGVSFMGTAYHASGKQPDWTHVPIPSSSSGMLGLNESDVNNGPKGALPRHANVPSNPSQQTSVTGSSILPVASSAAVYDGGLTASFQSHWSKAPAPPGSSTSISAAQNASAVGFNMMQTHQTRTMSNQLGHVPNLMDVSSGFSELPVLKPAANTTFASTDASAQFPDELGLGDSVTPRNVLLNDGSVSLPGSGHGNKNNSMGFSDLKLQHTHHVTHGSHGQSTGVNGSNNVELGFLTGSQDSRDLVDSLKPQKPVSRQGSSARRNVTSSFSELKSSSQASSADNVRTEWSGGNHRKGGSGRHTADRTNSGPSSKFKQIYVAKSTPVSAKANASANAGYRV